VQASIVKKGQVMIQQRKDECQGCEFDKDCHFRHYEYHKCYNLRMEEEQIDYYGSHSSGDYIFPDLAEAETDEEAGKRE